MSWWQHLIVSIFTAPCILAFVGGWCRKRCCQSCTFFTDNFTRADSDDPGDYTEVSGDWDISSNALVTSSSNGLLVADVQHPDGNPDINVEFTVSIPTSGDTARVILDYTDSNNYWFGEVKAGTGAYLRIYQRSGGTNTSKTSTSGLSLSTGTHTLCASITNGTLMSFSLKSSTGAVSFAGTFTQPVWGLGTGSNTGTVTFDSVTASVVSETCPPCSNCSNCSTGIPRQLKAVIAGFTNGSCSNCGAYNGTFFMDILLAPDLNMCAHYRCPIPGATCFGFVGGVVDTLDGFAGVSTRDVAVETRNNSGSSLGAWGDSYTGTANCRGWEDYLITTLSGGGLICTSGSSTCEVTSVL